MSAQRHNVHRCVCMCPGDPCVWSAVVHTQENIFISTCTRGVQAWVDHSDRIIQVSAGQCIQHRSAICVFTALTCTDLQISSKRLLFLNFGLEQIQNSKKSGRKKKLASHFSRSHFDTWMLPCHPWCHQSIFLWDPPTTNWPPPPPPLPPLPAPGWGQSVGHEKFGKIQPKKTTKMALNGHISWKN